MLALYNTQTCLTLSLVMCVWCLVMCLWFITPVSTTNIVNQIISQTQCLGRPPLIFSILLFVFISKSFSTMIRVWGACPRILTFNTLRGLRLEQWRKFPRDADSEHWDLRPSLLESQVVWSASTGTRPRTWCVETLRSLELLTLCQPNSWWHSTLINHVTLATKS